MSDLLPATDGLTVGLDGDVLLVGAAPSIGVPLTAPPYGVRFYDANGNNIWDVNEPAIKDVNDDCVYTVGTDIVLVGNAPPDGSPLLDPSMYDKFYDINGNADWDVGEPAIRDWNLDGLYTAPIRRWNLLPRRVTTQNILTDYIQGRIIFDETLQHLIVDRVDLSQRLMLLQIGDPPSEHGNEVHNPDMLSAFLPMGDYYNATDKTIGSAASVTLTTLAGTAGRWNIPSANFNFRPAATNTQDIILSVWWETPSGTQRSAKFLITVKLSEVKHPFHFGLPNRDLFDLAFWQSKFTTTQNILLKAQTNVESALVSDIYGNVLQVG